MIKKEIEEMKSDEKTTTSTEKQSAGGSIDKTCVPCEEVTASDSVVAAEQVAEKAIKGRKHKTRRKIILVLLIVLVVLVVILGISTLIGLTIVPSVQSWLVDHNFLTQEQSEDIFTTESKTRTLITEENWVIDVVDEAQRGVVSIAISEATLDPASGTIVDSSNIGTGFVIDESGLVLTNQHVVSDATAQYIVVTADGTEHEVTDIAQDDVNDLAILRVSDTSGLEALPLGDSSTLKAGQFVVAIGTPLGDLPGTVTTGIISGLGRSVNASSGGFWSTARQYEDVIQTDAAINPGNSGGPLLDVDGSVIGINFATTSGADNISFALPINRAKDRISQYQQYGRFIKPYLGVEYQLISSSEALFYRDVVAGAFVKRVVADSPAEKAGIEQGDIITKIGDEVVESAFSSIIQQYDVGDEVTITIWRDGESLEKQVILEEAE